MTPQDDTAESAPRTVYIIDDEPQIHMGLVVLLEQAEYTVESFTDGHLGLQAARRGRPSLIILDIDMPTMDGLTALRMLRDFPETHAIPVFMLTGRSDVDSVTEAATRGISGYIRKPYDPRDVLARLKSELSTD